MENLIGGENVNKNKDLFWHPSIITKKQRQIKNNHKSVILWFTGLSGSGKSTISNALESELFNMGKRTYLLDGDNIRHGINSDLDFSDKDRKENIRRVGEVAKLFVEAGIIVMAAFISPFRLDRLMVRELVEKEEFIEIYVKCPLSICEERDPKKLYVKARQGVIPSFTGISAPYEEPDNPEIIIETDKESIEQAVTKIISYLKNKHII